ncbi:hypothetical protein FE394_09145, partial [Xenorhabdus sp. Reich]
AKPDWEAIESVYRAGSLSIREIAAKHGVSDTAIRKRASANGWQRDLTDQVKKATRTKLVRSEVRSEVRRVGSQPEVRTDEDIIEQASSEAAEVVLGHRTDLADWRRIANKLRTFLDDVEITEDNHASIARTITAGVDAQIKLIKGERESYNIDGGDKNTATDNISDLMDDLAKG